MWWYQYWDILCYDSIERLGVPFGELPYKFAIGWARSVARVEGSHLNGKLQEESFKDYKRKQGQKTDVASMLAVKNVGGQYDSVTAEDNDYWIELERKYAGSSRD